MSATLDLPFFDRVFSHVDESKVMHWPFPEVIPGANRTAHASHTLLSSALRYTSDRVNSRVEEGCKVKYPMLMIAPATFLPVVIFDPCLAFADRLQECWDGA